MRWLLALYPPRWRHRYGEEFRALVASQPVSLHSTIDLIAGAIDAWLEPQRSTMQPAAAGKEKGVITMTSILKLGCSEGVNVTRADTRKSIIVMLGGTIVLTAIWMALHVRLGDQTCVDAFSAMAFMIPYLFSLRYTSLKGRSPATQAIFIGGMILLLSLIFVVAGWTAGRL